MPSDGVVSGSSPDGCTKKRPQSRSFLLILMKIYYIIYIEVFMLEIILAYLVGLGIIFLGVLSFKGNLSLLHSYHRKRVTEENKKPFSILVGTGHVIIGGFIIIANVFSTIVYFKGESTILTTLSSIIAIVGLIVGLSFCFYAMIKYNKGIF